MWGVGVAVVVVVLQFVCCCGREASEAAAMEVCSVGMKANVCFGQVKRRSVGSGESGIWGEGIGGGGGGGLKIKVWETKVVKGVRRRNSLGAAVAVLTSDVSEETMVSDFLFLVSSFPVTSASNRLCHRSRFCMLRCLVTGRQSPRALHP